MIANEVIDSCERSKKEIVLLKLDFHKACDSTSWSFLEWIFQKMKFLQKWCIWMKNCIEKARISILVNGVPMRPFKMHSGIQ